MAVDYRRIAAGMAQRYGVDPELFQRLVTQESRWNPDAVSPVGARGLTQVMPDTATSPGFGVEPLAKMDDPNEQLRFGAEYLGAMMRRYKGDTTRALAAYNLGVGNADEWSGRLEDLPAETQDYILKVSGGERVAQAETTTEDPRREQLMAEAQRRGLTGTRGDGKPGGFDRDALIQEAIKRGLLAEENAMPTEGVESQRATPGIGETVRMMVRDINAGFQGVNPVGVSQSTPIGVVNRVGEKILIDTDGVITELPQEKFGDYITQVDPQTGTEYLYKRTPEIEDPKAASVGRVLGYGPMGFVPGLLRAAQTAPKGPQAAMQAAQAADITPSLGMTGSAGARAAGAMESLYPTAGVVVNDATRAMGEVRGALAKTAESVGPGSGSIEGGNALIDGANSFLVANIKGSDAVVSTSELLFARVDRLIPKGTMIDVHEVWDTLGRFVERFADVPSIGAALGTKKWEQWLKDLTRTGGKLTWEQTRALRSAVGESIGKMTGPMASTSGGELKQIYGALSRDLDAAAKAAGKGAASAWANATNHYKWASGKVKEALDIMFKAKSPEAAYEAFLSLGKASGSRANLGKLLTIKRALPADEWSTVVASVIRKMGQAKPGGQNAAGDAFSASRFLTDWSDLSTSAKNALFTGKGVPNGLKAELDTMATMIESAKVAERQLNYSRSGSVMGNIALIGAGIADTTTAFVGMVAAHLTARVLTAPPVLRALRDYIAKGGNREAARKLLDSAGGNRALLVDIATIIRLETPERASESTRSPTVR